MKQANLRLCVLGVALATTAVFAGTYTALETAPNGNMTVTTANESVVTAVEPIAPAPVAEPAQPAQAAVPAQPAEPAVPARIAVPAEPAITVTEQRLTMDERIQAEVMDALARNDSLTGKVGVETRDRIVTLSGYLMTNGQVMRAGRDARSVRDVRYVVNEIRPRVGPITN